MNFNKKAMLVFALIASEQVYCSSHDNIYQNVKGMFETVQNSVAVEKIAATGTAIIGEINHIATEFQLKSKLDAIITRYAPKTPDQFAKIVGGITGAYVGFKLGRKVGSAIGEKAGIVVGAIGGGAAGAYLGNQLAEQENNKLDFTNQQQPEFNKIRGMAIGATAGAVAGAGIGDMVGSAAGSVVCGVIFAIGGYAGGEALTDLLLSYCPAQGQASDQ